MLLLDTCALIWTAEGTISHSAAEVLSGMAARRDRVLVSPISAWEIGMLVSKRRFTMLIPVERWFERVLSTDGVDLAPMGPPILIASSLLPGDPPNDPWDRVIVATARELGCPIMTRDRLLFAYAEQGHISVVSC